MKKGLVDIVTMGCSKNLVDSERLARRLQAKGWRMRHNPEDPQGEWVVVNTCGFIGDAKEESVNMILGLGALRGQKKIGNLAVMGCLSERYRKELEEEISEVDRWYGKFDWGNFVDSLPDLKEGVEPKPWERSLSTDPWTAYLKISEGCDRMCAYCAIPLITGRHKSRPIEEIVEEAARLASGGVKELNIIAQDLSAYGTDLDGNAPRLGELIDRLADVEGIEWIRLHYAYPTEFPWEVLEVMRRRPNVCNYLDVALQHISDPVLENMRRHITKEETMQFLERVRKEVPGIRLRTTLMVGFPGEGEKEFEELLDFVKEAKFDRMGAFAYSEEDDTWAQRHLKDDVPEEEKQRRLDALMALQEEVAAEVARRAVGEKVKVLVERLEGGKAVGRTQWDSPEVDPEIIVDLKGREAAPGEFINAVVTSAGAFELFADITD